MFIGRKELAFTADITKELVQTVIGQEVFYFAILADKTKTNDLYNEAIQKVWSDPVKCNALINYENSNEVIGIMPSDAKYKIDVYFHTTELNERNISPKMGDFVQYGKVMFEIYSVSESQIAFGMIDQIIMTKCNCGPARKGQFDPIKPAEHTPDYDKLAPLYSEQPSGRVKRR